MNIDTSAPLKLTLEFWDGSQQTYGCADRKDAWDTLRLVEDGIEVVSAWIDGEPWLGNCTDMRPGVP
jgi:hypothetical protein